MRRKIELTLALFLAFLLPQWASAQDQDTVKLQAQSEELQGRIGIVEPGSGLVFVERNSVSYSFHVTPTTRIGVANRDAKIEDLVARKGESVTVRFRAERDGNNIAEEITVP